MTCGQCEREARWVEPGGTSVYCDYHRERAERSRKIVLEERYCRRVVTSGDPQEACGQPARWRTRDGLLSCDRCRDERVSDRELLETDFLPLGPQ